MKKITVKSSLQVQADKQIAFEYFSNFENDIFWRAEIKQSVSSCRPPAVGMLITQTSFLSNKVPASAASLRCTDFTPHERIVCETIDGSKFWSRSTRVVTAADGNWSTITYKLEFDAAIVKHGLGFALPTLIVSLYTRLTMKKYLAALKHILETN